MTKKPGRLELTLPGGSLIRLSDRTFGRISRIHFPEKGAQKFVSKFFWGRVWSRVKRKLFRKSSSFNTNVPTAVVAVRGTTYDLKTEKDESAAISVYQGKVAVGPPLLVEGGQKEEFTWPVELSEKKWEEIIVGQLQRLRIGMDGRPGKPEGFDPIKEKDPWILWNQARDIDLEENQTPP